LTGLTQGRPSEGEQPWYRQDSEDAVPVFHVIIHISLVVKELWRPRSPISVCGQWRFHRAVGDPDVLLLS
jgi:hypothetical protein